MPYIEVEELPEGVEAVDVVPRADYDALVEERDHTIAQRDNALTMLEDARTEVRQAKARYAEAILDAGTKLANAGGEQKPTPTLAMGTTQLFGKEN